MRKATKNGVILLKRFGDRVRTLREANGLTREELAERANLSPQNVAKIELGERFVTAGSLERLSESLGAPVGELFNFKTLDSRKMPLRRKLELLLRHQTEARIALIYDVAARILLDA